ncbi:MAG: PDZ domain-containing protein [Acidobacteria bacterium]|nr:PDZ domain-containing protein [Acidobacteriota bacterium]
MKKTPWILLTALTLTLTTAASAGHGQKAKAEKADHECDKSAQDCLNSMAAHLKEKGWVGIELEAADNGFSRVSKVIDGSPAASAGMHTGDVLLAINEVELSKENKAELKKLKSSLAPGVKAKYTVLRDGSKQQVAVTLGNVPDELIARWIGEHMIDQHAYITLAAK